MSKIIVADDEVDLEMLIKQKFRRQIRENKYEFIFALNGNEALKNCKITRMWILYCVILICLSWTA